MLVHCFGPFLSQDMFLSLQVFAFERQNMMFIVNMLLAFKIVMPGSSVIEDREGGGGGGGPNPISQEIVFFKSQPVLPKLKSHSHFSIVFVS